MEKAKIESYIINVSNEAREEYGLLENPLMSKEYNYKWVLIPRKGNGDFTEIHQFITCVLSGKVCEITEDGVKTSSPTITPHQN